MMMLMMEVLLGTLFRMAEILSLTNRVAAFYYTAVRQQLFPVNIYHIGCNVILRKL